MILFGFIWFLVSVRWFDVDLFRVVFVWVVWLCFLPSGFLLCGFG